MNKLDKYKEAEVLMIAMKEWMRRADELVVGMPEECIEHAFVVMASQGASGTLGYVTRLVDVMKEDGWHLNAGFQTHDPSL